MSPLMRSPLGLTARSLTNALIGTQMYVCPRKNPCSSIAGVRLPGCFPAGSRHSPISVMSAMPPVGKSPSSPPHTRADSQGSRSVTSVSHQSPSVKRILSISLQYWAASADSTPCTDADPQNRCSGADADLYFSTSRCSAPSSGIAKVHEPLNKMCSPCICSPVARTCCAGVQPKASALPVRGDRRTRQRLSLDSSP